MNQSSGCAGLIALVAIALLVTTVSMPAPAKSTFDAQMYEVGIKASFVWEAEKNIRVSYEKTGQIPGALWEKYNELAEEYDSMAEKFPPEEFTNSDVVPIRAKTRNEVLYDLLRH